MKPAICRVCKSQYTKSRMGQVVCCPECAMTLARSKNAKAEKVEITRARLAAKAKLKTRSDWIKDVQIAFNAYVRARDAHQPCICCGKPLSAGDVGGAYDCGHYRSVGSAPHLRFDERNAHAQRKQCNRWGAGRAVDYRLGLIARIGQEAVDSLESDQSVRRYTVDELIALRAFYKAKLKTLKEAA